MTKFDINPFIRMLKGFGCKLGGNCCTKHCKLNGVCCATHIDPDESGDGNVAYEPTYLTGALATTTYLPPNEFGTWLYKSGEMVKETVSCSQTDLVSRYSNLLHKYEKLNDVEITPLKWSAGMLLDPDYIEHSMQYAFDYMILDNPDLLLHKILWKTIHKKVSYKDLPKAIHSAVEMTTVPGFLSSFVLTLDKAAYDELKNAGCTAVANMLAQYLKGQSYLGLNMNIFKDNRFVMSSLENFSPGISAFQQYPWMINFDGLPVFSRSGLGCIFTEQLSNFNNPDLLQTDNILMVTHKTRNPELYLEIDNGKRVKVKLNLLWPHQHFAAHGFKEYTLPMGVVASNMSPLRSNAHFVDQQSGFVWRIVAPDHSDHSSVANDCYLACLATNSLVAINREKGTLPFGRESKQRYHKTVDYYGLSDSMVIDGFYTTAPHISFVLVVGAHSQFPSLENFANFLSGITVTETNGEASMTVNGREFTNHIHPASDCGDVIRSIMNDEKIQFLISAALRM